MNIDIPTPRTDAEAGKPAFSPSEWIKFTRTLERETVLLRRALARLIDETDRSFDEELSSVAICGIEEAREQARLLLR